MVGNVVLCFVIIIYSFNKKLLLLSDPKFFDEQLYFII